MFHFLNQQLLTHPLLDKIDNEDEYERELVLDHRDRRLGKR
jgi:hypothetical protein